jgi:hypothetical protein
MVNPLGRTKTIGELMTDANRISARAAVDQLDCSMDSIERARKSLRLYQKHLERTNEMSLFDRAQKKRKEADRVVDLAVEENFKTSPPQQPVEITMVEKLRRRRQDKVQLANQLDEDIMALDHEITWLERHPGSEYVIKEFVRRHEEEVEKAKLDRPTPPRY